MSYSLEQLSQDISQTFNQIKTRGPLGRGFFISASQLQGLEHLYSLSYCTTCRAYANEVHTCTHIHIYRDSVSFYSHS